MTLTQATIGTDTLLKKVALVLAGTLLIALAAQIKVPMWPVPVTLQGLAILTVGMTFGARLGAITVLAYLAEGFMGLPVFAGLGAGPAYFAGPTAGFLLGFVAMAWIAGAVAERTRAFLPLAGAAIVASAIIYIPGLAWPFAVAGLAGVEASWVGSSAASLWTYWLSPFILGDLVKAVLAALVVSGGWAAFARR